MWIKCVANRYERKRGSVWIRSMGILHNNYSVAQIVFHFASCSSPLSFSLSLSFSPPFRRSFGHSTGSNTYRHTCGCIWAFSVLRLCMHTQKLQTHPHAHTISLSCLAPWGLCRNWHTVSFDQWETIVWHLKWRRRTQGGRLWDTRNEEKNMGKEEGREMKDGWDQL